MHEVSVVPKTIPFVTFRFLLIDADIFIEAVFYFLMLSGQRPDAESPTAVQIFGRGQQAVLVVQEGNLLRCFLLSMITILRQQPQLAGAGNAVGCAHTFLHVFVTLQQAVGNGVVVAEIHGLGLRTP